MQIHASRPAVRGFTLIELLTVIAIIGILAAILIPTVASVRASARTTRALSNAKQIGMANQLYANENRGRLLGQGVDFTDSEFMFRMFARYANYRANNSVDNVANILANLVDPAVPTEYLLYGSYPYTWSINSVFNMRQGRFYQGTSGWQSYPAGSDRNNTARRIEEFREPSRVIFAVSGGYEFGLTQAANEALTNTPTGRQAIFYYHRNGKATPAVFLDGHTELLTFPIAPERIRPQ